MPVDELKKRTWVYVMRPAQYEIAGCDCGNSDPDWSEFVDHLWCRVCMKDFVPAHWGVLDGPVPVHAAGLMGLSFDRYILSTEQVEKFSDWAGT